MSEPTPLDLDCIQAKYDLYADPNDRAGIPAIDAMNLAGQIPGLIAECKALRTTVAELTRERDEATAIVFARDLARAERDEARARVAEAVELLRTIVWDFAEDEVTHVHIARAEAIVLAYDATTAKGGVGV